MTKPKSFCYLPNCRAVKTGFIWSEWLVCSECKLEISEDLYKSIKEKEERKKKQEKKEDDNDHPWGYI